MSEHRFLSVPVAGYGVTLLAAAIAYYILQTTLLRAEGKDSLLRTAIGSDFKGKLSPALYCVGIGLCFANRWIGVALYVAVALIWLVPDRRVERHLIPAAPADARTPEAPVPRAAAPEAPTAESVHPAAFTPLLPGTGPQWRPERDPRDPGDG